MANQDSTTTLYNGLYKATFKNSSHRYYIDGKLQPGVTTIIGKVIAKPGLMLWPLNMAIHYIRSNCIDETFRSSPNGERYALYDTDLDLAAKAYTIKRDAGADTGTIVHGLAEQLLADSNGKIETADLSSEAQAAFSAFCEWYIQVEPTAVAVEQVVYSPTYGYAGTFDSVLEINGKVYLCDLKTTNAGRDAPQGVYPENFIQLGAYLLAYNEQRNYELAHGGTELRKIDDLMIISCKKNGVLDTVTANNLDLSLIDCQDMWRQTLALQRTLDGLKKRLGEK